MLLLGTLIIFGLFMFVVVETGKRADKFQRDQLNNKENRTYF